MARAHAAAVVVVAGCFGAGEDVPPPRLGSLVPDRGAPGIAVEIAGEHFCQRPEAPEDDAPPCEPRLAQIYFATTPAETSITDDRRAIATVPALPPGPVDVLLSVDGRDSNRLEFVVALAP